jgi:hypothetical protein
MSDKESDRGSPQGPVFPPQPKSSKISISEIAELRKVFEDSALAKWVVLAGIGGLVELLRLAVDILRYVDNKGF